MLFDLVDVKRKNERQIRRKKRANVKKKDRIRMKEIVNPILFRHSVTWPIVAIDRQHEHDEYFSSGLTFGRIVVSSLLCRNNIKDLMKNVFDVKNRL